MRRILLTLTLASLGLLAITVAIPSAGLAPSNAVGAVPNPATDGSMAVDCDATTPGVQASCAYPAGASFQVQVHVLGPVLRGYVGFQANLRLPAGLDYLPAEELADEALWEKCAIPVRYIGTEEHAEGPHVLSGCMPLPFPDELIFDAGAMFQYRFECPAEGQASLTLQEVDDIGIRGSYAIDMNLDLIEPSPVTNATITCLPDSDNDGCADGQELGVSALTGGQRDPLYHWDFFDTPNAQNSRDRRVTVGDIGSVVARFGATGNPDGDPLGEPPPAPAYHSAFDRGGQAGPRLWDLAPADGNISVGDIGSVVAQFGHSCA